MHAGRKRAGRLARIAVTQIRKRAVALIVGVPLAVCAIGFPSDAMNLTLPALKPVTSFPIFNTPRVRATFGKPQVTAPQHIFTLDATKEDFFRTEIPYGAIIYREATRNNLPPELVAAVIESESDFRPHLVSDKNAQGLMQIVPETGRLLVCDNPFNPSQNIAAGTRYLRYLVNRFGDQRTALAAYNAGEGNVERFGGVPPFAETTNYVQRVNSRTRFYRQRVQNRYVAALRMRAPVVE